MKKVLFTLFALFIFLSSAARGADWATLAAQVRPSLGFVEMLDENGNHAGSCTAFSINDAKDYFLTADHCAEFSMTVDGKMAFPIYADETSDLMVLVVPDSGSYPAFKLASEVATGEPVAAYGWGFGLEFPTFKAGEVATPSVKVPELATNGYGTPDDTYTILDFDVIHGMSGGPVFNEKGELISIVQLAGPDYVGVGRSLGEITAKVGNYFTANQ